MGHEVAGLDWDSTGYWHVFSFMSFRVQTFLLVWWGRHILAVK